MPISTQLLDLLAARHAGDVFVPECKDGPTHYTQHQRLDAWAMKRSWRHPLAVGYEIKVARSDFLRDDKWRGYLPYCNEFYFVAPSGVIDKVEVPAETGLLVASRNLTRLYAKKKAVWRDVKIPESIYRYILMSRTVVTREHAVERGTKAFWERWVAGREDDDELGRRVGKKLRQTINSRIVQAEEENRRLAEQMKGYDEIRALLKQLGYEADDYFSVHTVNSRLKEQVTGISRELLWALVNARRSLAQACRELKAIQDSKPEPVTGNACQN